jgi:hypothetical protein
MTDYELTFIVDPMTDEQEDAILDRFDCLLGTNHIGDNFIVLTVSGNDAFHAAKNAHMELVEQGVVVDRLDYDLADRSQIAERLDITRQAVGNYIRGDRKAETPFPRAFNETGPCWLWGDVVRWSRQALEHDPAPDLDFPDRHDIAKFNACIVRGYVEAPAPVGVSYPAYRVPLAPRTAHLDWAKGLTYGNDFQGQIPLYHGPSLFGGSGVVGPPLHGVHFALRVYDAYEIGKHAEVVADTLPVDEGWTVDY